MWQAFWGPTENQVTVAFFELLPYLQFLESSLSWCCYGFWSCRR